MAKRLISDLAQDILRFQKQKVIDSVVKRLADQNVHRAEDLLIISKDALEFKLYNDGNLSLDETSHTMSLREWAENHVGTNSRNRDMPIGGSMGDSQAPWRKANCDRPCKAANYITKSYRQGPWSRSPWQSRGKGTTNQGKGSWNRGKRNRQVDSRRPRRELPKPPIWAAVEQGDFLLVSRLIAKGYDIEQKIQKWSPLMKAAEENETRILHALLQQKTNLEAKNQKGRRALSFAACPSMRRNTTCDTLRMLLENNADPSMKDDNGLTPKAHAIREKRQDALKILEQFGH